MKHIKLFESDDSYTHPYIYELAHYLHSIYCSYNHTDGCGYYYEDEWFKGDLKNPELWKKSEHSRWFSKATKIFDEFDLSEIEDFLNLKKEIDKKQSELRKILTKFKIQPY